MTDQNSLKRVRDSARKLGLTIDILEMPKSTRTAVQAAAACNCQISQIVKSLIFTDSDNGGLILFLIAGENEINLSGTENFLKTKLIRAEPREIRQKTGFAIGGISPIGHLSVLPVYLDSRLLDFETVWAAAGTPNSVFSVNPSILGEKTGAIELPPNCLTPSSSPKV